MRAARPQVSGVAALLKLIPVELMGSPAVVSIRNRLAAALPLALPTATAEMPPETAEAAARQTPLLTEQGDATGGVSFVVPGQVDGGESSLVQGRGSLLRPSLSPPPHMDDSDVDAEAALAPSQPFGSQGAAQALAALAEGEADKQQLAAGAMEPATGPEAEDAPCQQCGGSDRDDELLLCDQCNTPWHCGCVGLAAVPSGDWWCPRCLPVALPVAGSVPPILAEGPEGSGSDGSSSSDGEEDAFVCRAVDPEAEEAPAEGSVGDDEMADVFPFYGDDDSDWTESASGDVAGSAGAAADGAESIGQGSDSEDSESKSSSDAQGGPRAGHCHGAAISWRREAAAQQRAADEEFARLRAAARLRGAVPCETGTNVGGGGAGGSSGGGGGGGGAPTLGEALRPEDVAKATAQIELMRAEWCAKSELRLRARAEEWYQERRRKAEWLAEAERMSARLGKLVRGVVEQCTPLDGPSSLQRRCAVLEPTVHRGLELDVMIAMASLPSLAAAAEVAAAARGALDAAEAAAAAAAEAAAATATAEGPSDAEDAAQAVPPASKKRARGASGGARDRGESLGSESDSESGSSEQSDEEGDEEEDCGGGGGNRRRRAAKGKVPGDTTVLVAGGMAFGAACFRLRSRSRACDMSLAHGPLSADDSSELQVVVPMGPCSLLEEEEPAAATQPQAPLETPSQAAFSSPQDLGAEAQLGFDGFDGPLAWLQRKRLPLPVEVLQLGVSGAAYGCWVPGEAVGLLPAAAVSVDYARSSGGLQGEAEEAAKLRPPLDRVKLRLRTEAGLNLMTTRAKRGGPRLLRGCMVEVRCGHSDGWVEGLVVGRGCAAAVPEHHRFSRAERAAVVAAAAPRRPALKHLLEAAEKFAAARMPPAGALPAPLWRPTPAVFVEGIHAPRALVPPSGGVRPPGVAAPQRPVVLTPVWAHLAQPGAGSGSPTAVLKVAESGALDSRQFALSAAAVWDGAACAWLPPKVRARQLQDAFRRATDSAVGQSIKDRGRRVGKALASAGAPAKQRKIAELAALARCWARRPCADLRTVGQWMRLLATSPELAGVHSIRLKILRNGHAAAGAPCEQPVAATIAKPKPKRAVEHKEPACPPGWTATAPAGRAMEELFPAATFPDRGGSPVSVDAQLMQAITSRAVPGGGRVPVEEGKAHQREGVRFMWNATVSGAEANEDGELHTGCVLAHSMGLGKTLQVLIFLHTWYAAHHSAAPCPSRGLLTVLVVPKNVLLNWEKELKSWLDPLGWGLCSSHLFIVSAGDAMSKATIRAWAASAEDGGFGGVLLLTYQSFVTFTKLKQPKQRSRHPDPEHASRPGGASGAGRADVKQLTQRAQLLISLLPQAGINLSDLARTALQRHPEEFQTRKKAADVADLAEEGRRAFNNATSKVMACCKELVNSGHVLKVNKLYYVNDVDLKPLPAAAAAAVDTATPHAAEGAGRCAASEERPAVLGVGDMQLNKVNEPDTQAEAAKMAAATAAAEIRKLLLEGPDLLVADEAHDIRNNKSQRAAALKQITTLRRIALTGFPLQNKLSEFWCMIDFVRPGHIGSESDFKISYVEPIEAGQGADAGEDATKRMNEQLSVLHQLLEPVVQRFGPEALTDIIGHTKREHVLHFRASELQHRLLAVMWKHLVGEGDKVNYFTGQNCQRKVGGTMANILGPVRDLLTKRRSAEAAGAGPAQAAEAAAEVASKLLDSQANEDMELAERILPSQRAAGTTAAAAAEAKSEARVKSTEAMLYELADVLREAGVDPEDPKAVVPCGKMWAAMQLVRAFRARDEKTLLFTENVQTLDQLCVALQQEGWKQGEHFCRIDGAIKEARQSLIDEFNSPHTGLRLFLISTRAGGVGINLQSATRCILYESLHNPCHNAQAVCRMYRLGQAKETYVYRLVMGQGWHEMSIYKTATTKEALQRRVMDKQSTRQAYETKQAVGILLPPPPIPPSPPETAAVLAYAATCGDEVLQRLLQPAAEAGPSTGAAKCAVAQWVHSVVAYTDVLQEDVAQRLSEEEKASALEKHFEAALKRPGSLNNLNGAEKMMMKTRSATRKEAAVASQGLSSPPGAAAAAGAEATAVASTSGKARDRHSEGGQQKPPRPAPRCSPPSLAGLRSDSAEGIQEAHQRMRKTERVAAGGDGSQRRLSEPRSTDKAAQKRARSSDPAHSSSHEIEAGKLRELTERTPFLQPTSKRRRTGELAGSSAKGGAGLVTYAAMEDELLAQQRKLHPHQAPEAEVAGRPPAAAPQPQASQQIKSSKAPAWNAAERSTAAKNERPAADDADEVIDLTGGVD